MRVLLTPVFVVVVAVVGASAAAPARAGSFDVPALSIDRVLEARVLETTHSATLTPSQGGAFVAAPAGFTPADSGNDVAAGRRTYLIPQRYAFVLDDGRAFWFAAGASAAASLGAHVLLGIPIGLFVTFGALSAAAASPAVGIPLALGLGGTYLLLHAVGAGLLAGVVFNSTSQIYDGSLLASIAAHAAGNVLAAGATTMVFGAGGMVMASLYGLSVFTGSAGLETVLVLTLLGALPAVVVAGAALVVVPAVLGAWALAVTATPADGYAIAPDWRRPVSETGPDAPAIEGSTASRRMPRDAAALPVAQVQFGP